jgi:hypothetical protein
LFGVTTSPSGEILSFIAKNSGEWELYRVRNWLSKSPIEEKLFLPGYFSKSDAKDLETLSADVYVTSDGRYAICVGHAWWNKRVAGRSVGHSRSDSVITVIDLSMFRIMSTTRTAALGLLEFQGVTLDRHDKVLLNSEDNPREHLFIQLNVPSLTPGPKCGYRMMEDAPGKEHSEIINEIECREALKSASLDQYLQETSALPSSAQIFRYCENNSAKFCKTGGGKFTTDGKFGVAEASEGHDNIFGSWVITSKKYIVFSTTRLADITEITVEPNEDLRSASASLLGRDYLILIRDGTQFRIYELKD